MNTIIYKTHYQLFRKLPGDKVKQLLEYMEEFTDGGEPDVTDELLSIIWIPIRNDLNTQRENYHKKGDTSTLDTPNWFYVNEETDNEG
jgi:hypothetical protein